MTSKGFSLIELLVTVGILGVLAAVAIPSYQKYNLSAKQANQKKELAQVAKALEYARSVDGGYHQKIWTAGYRPPTTMPVNVGTSTKGRTQHDLCCNQYPKRAISKTNPEKLDGFLTLTREVYNDSHVDSSTTADHICGHPEGNCKMKIDPTNQRLGKNNHTAGGGNSDCDSAFTGSNQQFICDCNRFIIQSKLNKTGNTNYRAYINEKGLLCAGETAGSASPLKKL